MKKKLFVLLMVLMALSMVTSPALARRRPDKAEGLWQYQPFVLDVKEVGCKTYLTTFENGIWTGTFKGTSTEDGKILINCKGAWFFKAMISFEGSVDGKSGTLKMWASGWRPDTDTEWRGRYVILSGTGELANLRGLGRWWGPGATAPEAWGDIYYEGRHHFKH